VAGEPLRTSSRTRSPSTTPHRSPAQPPKQGRTPSTKLAIANTHAPGGPQRDNGPLSVLWPSPFAPPARRHRVKPAAMAARVSRSTRNCVRFWEQNGSGETMAGAVRRGHNTLLGAADVQERPRAAASSVSVLSSHRGGQGFKSPQLHANPQVSALTCGQSALACPFCPILGAAVSDFGSRS